MAGDAIANRGPGIPIVSGDIGGIIGAIVVTFIDATVSGTVGKGPAAATDRVGTVHVAG